MDFNELQEAAIQSLQHPGAGGKPMPKTSSKKPPILYVFRHTQTYDNIRRVFSGKRQSQLTPKGKKQAQELAHKLVHMHIDLFISPDLIRCRQTLEPLQKMLPHIPYLVKKELVERDYGILTGKSKMEAMKEHPKNAVLWRRSWDVAPPKGESIKNVWENRIHPFCKWLETKMKKENINIAYSGTNNTVRLIRMYFEHLSYEDSVELENTYADYASYHIK